MMQTDIRFFTCKNSTVVNTTYTFNNNNAAYLAAEID